MGRLYVERIQDLGDDEELTYQQSVIFRMPNTNGAWYIETTSGDMHMVNPVSGIPRVFPGGSYGTVH